jgi:hypothetical protein
LFFHSVALRTPQIYNKYRRVKNPILIALIFGYNTPIVKMMPPESGQIIRRQIRFAGRSMKIFSSDNSFDTRRKGRVQENVPPLL